MDTKPANPLKRPRASYENDEKDNDENQLHGYLIIENFRTIQLRVGDITTVNGILYKVIAVRPNLVLRHTNKVDDSEEKAAFRRRDIHRQKMLYIEELRRLAKDRQHIQNRMCSAPTDEEQKERNESLKWNIAITNKQKEEHKKLQSTVVMEVSHDVKTTTTDIKLPVGEPTSLVLPGSPVVSWMTWTLSSTGPRPNPVTQLVTTEKMSTEFLLYPPISGVYGSILCIKPPDLVLKSVVGAARSSSPDGAIFIATPQDIYSVTLRENVAKWVKVSIQLYGDRPIPIEMLAIQENHLFILDGAGTVWVYNIEGMKLIYLRNWRAMRLNGKETEFISFDVIGLTVSREHVFVCDQRSKCIYVYNHDGHYQYTIDDKRSQLDSKFIPHRLATMEDGELIVCCPQNKFCEMFTSDGDSRVVFKLPDMHTSKLFAPSGVVVNGDQVIVADQDNRTIWVFDLEGNLTGEWSTTGNGVQTTGPTAMTMVDGKLLVVVGEGLCFYI